MNSPAAVVEEIFDLVIGTGGGRPLHVDIARPKQIPDQPMPAVLWIHGGAWRKGSRKGNPALFLAAQGYFILGVEYRLSGEAIWPAQLEDCKLAVRWLRANAEKYHVDPKHIGCWGHSAGGHLATCLGTMGDPVQFEGEGGYPGVSSEVQAVLSYCGPVDFSRGSYRLATTANDVHDEVLVQLFGGPFATHQDQWEKGSPVGHVHAGMPPFLVIHGDADQTVPIHQSQRLVEVLKQTEVTVELITVRGGSHSMMVPPGDPGEKELQAAILAFFDKYLGRKV